MFTFSNNVSQQMGDLRRLNVRRTARSSAARLLWHVPIGQPSAAAGKKKARRSRAGRFTVPQWGLTGRRNIRIGKTNLCYFFKRLSRYCFLSCNRCSFMSNNGHLLIFNATFIFSHRSSSTFSIAAKSFMVLYRKDVLLKYSRRRVLLPQV